MLANATAGSAAPTAIATSSFFGQGLSGQVLAWNGGVPQWVATTTLTNGTGITTTYNSANNQWTITNTGATFAFPFTTLATYGTTSAATSSSIQTAGVFFASSTAAASVFPYASSTAFTASGSGYFATDAGSKVGIGTTSPWALLSINPNGIAGPAFAIGSSTATNFLVTNAGKVGIGTTSPAYALDVNGDVNVASGKCFRVNGVCIGYVTKLAAIYATSSVGTTTVQFGNGGPSFSNGTLTLPATTTQMVVEVWGGGAAGGGAHTSANYGGGGGGGAGGYSAKLFSSLGSGYYFTIGAGGTGVSQAAGNNGMQSCFGTNATACTSPSVQANGGTGGTAGNGSIAGTGGAGGSVGTGDVTKAGGSGTGGGGGDAGIGGSGGHGGTSPSGGGGGAGSAYQRGDDGTAGGAFGGGGGGGGGSSFGTTGGNGGSGGIVITVYATSSPNAAGNDYAEMFPVSNPGITAGDIVAVDAGIPISMKLAVASDDAPLAGIIATDPGQLLGDKNAVGSRPVALSGRVPAKVNLEGGPISIGDRIAPSSVPGVGKKAGPFDDSVGIALNSFPGSADGSSQGSVTVFIDLQRGIDVNAIAFALLGLGDPIFAVSTSSAASSTSPLDFVGRIMNEFSSRMDSLANLFATSTDASSTTATATSTPSDTYASDFLHSLFAQVARWLADAANGITNLFADTFHARKEICIQKSDGADACVTGDQLAAVLSATNQTPQGDDPLSTPASAEPPPSDTVTSTDSTSSPQAAATSSPPTSEPSTSPEPSDAATTSPVVTESTLPLTESTTPIANSPPLAPEEEPVPDVGPPTVLDAASLTETAPALQ